MPILKVFTKGKKKSQRVIESKCFNRCLSLSDILELLIDNSFVRNISVSLCLVTIHFEIKINSS